MGKLEELRQIVAEMFEGATEKEDIEKLATINNKINSVEEEQDAIVKKNAELITSYKDLVQHTSFKDKNVPTDSVGGTMPSFEDALASFIANQK